MMNKSTENEQIKSLTHENAELIDSICSWSKNCAQLTDKMTKLQFSHKKLTAENTELQSKLDTKAAQLQRNSRDTKYVMELLEKTTLQNRELKAENKDLINRLNCKKIAEHERDQSTMTAAMKNVELRKTIRKKNELIEFYKEICDAKVSEVRELQKINRILKNHQTQ